MALVRRFFLGEPLIMRTGSQAVSRPGVQHSTTTEIASQQIRKDVHHSAVPPRFIQPSKPIGK